MTETKTQNTYHSLRQPRFSPPSWLFGPAWTVLYGLMGYAAHRAYTQGLSATALPSTRLLALQGATLYTIQLGLNLLWTPLFFYLKRPVLATGEIVVLTGTVAWLMNTWAKVDTVAAACLVPYLGWLSFATYLAAGVGYLNDWDLRTEEEKSLAAVQEKGKGKAE